LPSHIWKATQNFVRPQFIIRLLILLIRAN
jgi:hypothetical protein